MDPLLLKIPLSVDESFSVRTDISKAFYNQWHYHPEIELIYILQGSGKGFFGDSVCSVSSDELYLLGPNLPHMLKSEIEERGFYGDESEQITESVVVHFRWEIFDSFLRLPENKKVNKLIEEVSGGLKITGEVKEEVKKLIQLLRYAPGSRRLIYLLDILRVIAESGEKHHLSSTSFKGAFNKNDENRLNRIYHYTLNNFARNITLKEIAELVHMSPHAFCRYFRSRTHKRYSLFLLEIRVSHACKLLSGTDYSVAVVSYESGFMNFSNFNRHFKLITGKTPLEYRRQFHS